MHASLTTLSAQVREEAPSISEAARKKHNHKSSTGLTGKLELLRYVVSCGIGRKRTTLTKLLASFFLVECCLSFRLPRNSSQVSLCVDRVPDDGEKNKDCLYCLHRPLGRSFGARGDVTNELFGPVLTSKY